MARVKDVFSGVPHCTSKNVSSFPLPAPESTHPHTYRPTDPKEGSGPKLSLSLPPHPVGEPALVTLRSPVGPGGPARPADTRVPAHHAHRPKVSPASPYGTLAVQPGLGWAGAGGRAGGWERAY